MKRKKIINIILACLLILSYTCHYVVLTKASNKMNLALHKPATVSYQDSESHGADKVVDGDLDTRWGSDPKGSNQWVKVDLQHTFLYDEFYIASENNNAQKIRKYKIEGSNDDENYVLIYQSKDNPSGFDLEHTVLLEQNVSYRYVKMTVENLIDGAYPSISLREFGIYGNGGVIGDVENALKDLTIPTKLYRNFELPAENKDLGVQFMWSSDQDAIEIKDGMAIIQASDVQKSVTLTVNALKDNYTKSRSFQVQVMPITENDYTIYPKPHQITYGSATLDMTSNVNVVFSNAIDDTAKNYLCNMLESFQLHVNVSDKMDTSMVNIMVGKSGDQDVINQHFDTLQYEKKVAESEEGYALHVATENKTVAILGKDKEGIFNGIFTLKQMLESSYHTLKDIVIADAPDTKFRGIVEGFYGTYSHKERLDLLAFIGPLKMNTYIYGSKSDVYHYAQWRDPYPEAKIKELAELVACGKQNNVEVIWSAHVGGHINMASEADYEALVKKFDQLYAIGVRQFGIFYDDAGTDNTHLTAFVNRVNREYIAKREGVKDLIICPQEYNKKAASDAYLSKLAAFDSNVQVMWTGDSVISEINPEMMAYIEEKIKRPAYMWWNYPVNDLGMGDQLLVGETVGLSTEMQKMNGVVSNPMLQWQASKFSVFSIADYCWNIEAFDRHQSWKDGVDYIIPEKTYADAFRTFSSNNNQSLFELKQQAVESEYLIPILDTFKQAYYLEEDIEEQALKIKDEFQKLEDACELLNTYTTNPELVNQIMPWLHSMEKVTKAGRSIMENIIYINANDLDNQEVVSIAYQNYLACQNDLSLIGGKLSGRRILTPFLEEMQGAIKNTLTQKLGYTNHRSIITSYRDGAMKLPDMTKMVDGDLTSFVVFEDNEINGSWFGLDLGKATNIYNIEILLGENKEDKNVAKTFKVQISQDGVNWDDIKADCNQNTIYSFTNTTARFVRYFVEEGCKTRTKVREFSVNKVNETVYTNVTNFKQNVICENNGVIELTPIYDFALKTNEYIGIQFDKVKDFADMACNIKDLTLEYSQDRKTWHTYQGSAFRAKYIRLINKTAETYYKDEMTLQVTKPEKFSPNELSISKNNDLVIYSGNEKDLIDGNRDTYCWTRDQKIGQAYTIDLHEEMPIKDICVVMISGDSLESGVVEISKDNVNWESVGTIAGEKEKLIQVQDEKFARYIRVRVTANSNTWLKINEVEINKQANKAEIPILDNESANAIHDHNIMTSFNSNDTGELNYYNFNTPFAQTLRLFKDPNSVITIEGLFQDEWKTIVTDNKAYIDVNFATLGYASQFKISWTGSLTLYEFIPSNENFNELEDTTLARKILYGAILKVNTAELSGQLEKLAPIVKSTIISKRDSAQIVYDNENASNQAILQAWSELADALHFLDFKADKVALKNFIDLYQEIDLTMYTEESAEVFKTAYAFANAVYIDENALQTRIDEAYTSIEKAVKGLVKKDTVDKTFLQLMVDYIVEKIEDDTNYKKDNYWQALQQALQHAIDVLADETVSQKEINAMIISLADAYEEIRLLPDESQLAQLRYFSSKLKQLNRSLYSDSQLAMIDEANAEVQSMLQDFDSKKFASLEVMVQNVLMMNPEKATPTTQPQKPLSQNDTATDVVKKANIVSKTATSDNTKINRLIMIIALSGLCVCMIQKQQKH